MGLLDRLRDVGEDIGGGLKRRVGKPTLGFLERVGLGYQRRIQEPALYDILNLIQDPRGVVRGDYRGVTTSALRGARTSRLQIEEDIKRAIPNRYVRGALLALSDPTMY